MRELIAKQAIPSHSIPPYFGAWVQLSSDLCMYTPIQQKRYALNHLQAGCWYLDCPAGYTPDEEVEIRHALDASSSPSAGAADVMDITEEDSVQPARGEGSSSKKGRKTKAAKEMATQPMDATTVAASSLPSSPAVVADGHVAIREHGTSAQVSSQLHPSSSVLEATEQLRGQRKFQQMPSSSTSIGQALPVLVMLENASLFAVMETLGTPTGPDPLWSKLHEFVSKVYHLSFVSKCLSFYFVSFFSLISSFPSVAAF